MGTKGFCETKSPCFGDQIPSWIVPLENALGNSHRNFSETTVFIVVSRSFGPLFRQAPKTPKNHLAESSTMWRRLGGGDFCTKSPFRFCSFFFLASSGPLPTKDGLKTPIFVVFYNVFGSQIFRSPAAFPHDVCYVFWGFFKKVPKKAPKNSQSRGANSVAGIPSPYSPRVYRF